MITVGMNYKVIEGKERIFENAFEGVLKVMEQDPGHTASSLFRDVHATGVYVILSDWSSEEAFQQFIRSERFAKVANWGKEQILRDRPTHEIYRK